MTAGTVPVLVVFGVLGIVLGWLVPILHRVVLAQVPRMKRNDSWSGWLCRMYI